jgi:carboxymethylenebutenolidase
LWRGGGGASTTSTPPARGSPGAHDIEIYPAAGHGFMNDHDPADQTPLLTFLAKISGTRFHEPSARDARRRIVDFFNEHLQP